MKGKATVSSAALNWLFHTIGKLTCSYIVLTKTIVQYISPLKNYWSYSSTKKNSIDSSCATFQQPDFWYHKTHSLNGSYNSPSMMDWLTFSRHSLSRSHTPKKIRYNWTLPWNTVATEQNLSYISCTLFNAIHQEPWHHVAACQQPTDQNEKPVDCCFCNSSIARLTFSWLITLLLIDPKVLHTLGSYHTASF